MKLIQISKKTVVWVLAFALAAILCVLAVQGVRRAADNVNRISGQALENTVMQAVFQCYAVEGVYPPDVSYLEEHYGLVINHSKFIVAYDAFSSNLPPDVTVLEKGV